MRPATFKMSYWYAQFAPVKPGSPRGPNWHAPLIWLAYSIYYHASRSPALFVFRVPNKHPGRATLARCWIYTKWFALFKWIELHSCRRVTIWRQEFQFSSFLFSPQIIRLIRAANAGRRNATCLLSADGLDGEERRRYRPHRPSSASLLRCSGIIKDVYGSVEDFDSNWSEAGVCLSVYDKCWNKKQIIWQRKKDTLRSEISALRSLLLHFHV